MARLTSVLAVVLALSAACSADDEPTPDPGRGPGTPVVGACRLLTAADIQPASNETPTVPCTSPHTSETIAVRGFRAAAVTNQSLTNGTLGNQALARCTTAWKQTLGGDTTAQHTSVAELAYYLPNQQQLSQGARWYRCDLVLGGQGGLPLQNLTRSAAGLLDGTVPDVLRACRTTSDFVSGREVTCDRPHALRAIGTAPLPDVDAYPGTAALRAASAKGCSRVIKRWLHGRIDGGDAYQWPDRTGWEVLHDHVATCWTVTRD
ncbi:MAG: septum formation family protein [Nocardioidaceae bacterium]